MKKIVVNQNGFSLVSVMIAVGLMGGVALGVMKLSEQISGSRTSAQSIADEVNLSSVVRSILKNPRHCKASFSDVSFKKEEVDFDGEFVEVASDYTDESEGLSVELWYSSPDGSKKTVKKLNGFDYPPVAGEKDMSQHGKIKVESLKLVMSNGDGKCDSNYCPGVISDIGQLVVLYNRKINNKKSRLVKKIFDLNLSLFTDRDGNSKVLSCVIEKSIEERLNCYTIRRYVKTDYKHGFVVADGSILPLQNGIIYSDVARLRGGCCASNPLSLPHPVASAISPLGSSGVASQWFGIECREDKKFFMTGCAHAVGSVNTSSDMALTKNGCFAKSNSGSATENQLDIRCCRYGI